MPQAFEDALSRLATTKVPPGEPRRGPFTFRRILLATDGSPSAEYGVSWAAEISKAFGSTIRIVAVVQPETAYQSLGEGDAIHIGREAFLQDNLLAHDAVAAAQQQLSHMHVDGESTVKYGAATLEIEREAKAWGADLIVLGSHSRSAAGRLLLGSVADGVKNHAAASVLIARSEAPVARVLVGVDGSEASRRAAGIALRLARRWKAAAHLEYVYEAPAFGPIEGDLTKMLRRGDPSTEAFAPDVTYHVAFGRAADSLVQEAKSRDCGLIVVGSRGLGEFRRLVLGSVSNRVAHEAATSVLVVKRPD